MIASSAFRSTSRDLGSLSPAAYLSLAKGQIFGVKPCLLHHLRSIDIKPPWLAL